MFFSQNLSRRKKIERHATDEPTNYVGGTAEGRTGCYMEVPSAKGIKTHIPAATAHMSRCRVKYTSRQKAFGITQNINYICYPQTYSYERGIRQNH
jgi:hypothetical protein